MSLYDTMNDADTHVVTWLSCDNITTPTNIPCTFFTLLTITTTIVHCILIKYDERDKYRDCY
jgi:hypothetical protein